MDTFEALEKNSIVNRDRPGVVIHMRLQETNLRSSLLELFSGFGTRRGFCEGTSGDPRSAGRRCAAGRRPGGVRGSYRPLTALAVCQRRVPQGYVAGPSCAGGFTIIKPLGLFREGFAISPTVFQCTDNRR